MSNSLLGPAAFAALGLLFASGCGGEPTSKVSGSVTLDGVPVENGSISFYPTGKTGRNANAGIEHGKYQLDASVGEMTVQISATRVVGKFKAYDTPESPVLDKVAEVVPPEFNSASKLTVTLKAGQNDGVNFDLVTKKKK